MPLGSRKPPTAPPPASPPRKPRRPVDRRQLDRDSDVRLLVGSTGSGKTYALRKWLKDWQGRVFVWDWKQEFVEYPLASTVPELAQMAKRTQRLRYIPNMIPPRSWDGTARAWVDQQFEYFCRIAWAVQEADPQTDMAFVVEEASEVTRASGAPPWWSRIITQGRVLGFSPVALTQRPVLVDATTRSATDYLRVGVLQFPDDAKTMGMMVRRTAAEIMAMPKRHAYVRDKGELREELP